MTVVHTDWWVLGAGLALLVGAAASCWSGQQATQTSTAPFPAGLAAYAPGPGSAPAILFFCGSLLVFAGVPKRGGATPSAD
jgi:hypothetical protein